jgi:hypothetical protein
MVQSSHYVRRQKRSYGSVTDETYFPSGIIQHLMHSTMEPEEEKFAANISTEQLWRTSDIVCR